MARLPARGDDLPYRPMPVPDRRRLARRARPARARRWQLAQTAVTRAVLALLLLASCSALPGASAPPSASADRVLRGGTLRVAQSADIGTLDPWTATDDDTFEVLRQVFEPLVDTDPVTLRAVPLLASRWTVSADARVWTFTLRTGVRFHDGTSLDAAAVVFNFDRGRTITRSQLDTLIDTVTATDPSTVVFTLRSGYAPFLATLASPSFGIVSPACVKQGVTWSTPATRCAAGTGPFRVETGAWQSGTKIALLRNANYWGRDADGRQLPFVDGVTFLAVRDE